jgi:hypothetical protein
MADRARPQNGLRCARGSGTRAAQSKQAFAQNQMIRAQTNLSLAQTNAIACQSKLGKPSHLSTEIVPVPLFPPLFFTPLRNMMGAIAYRCRRLWRQGRGGSTAIVTAAEILYWNRIGLKALNPGQARAGGFFAPVRRAGHRFSL